MSMSYHGEASRRLNGPSLIAVIYLPPRGVPTLGHKCLGTICLVWNFPIFTSYSTGTTPPIVALVVRTKIAYFPFSLVNCGIMRV